MCFRKVPCLWALMLWATSLEAQQFDFRILSVEHGLPGATVHALCLTDDGFLWVGSSGGVSRTDGRRFNNHTRGLGLPGERTLALMPAGDGAVWAGLERGGLVRVGPQGITTLEDAPFARLSVTAIAKDSSAQLWVATAGEGVWYGPAHGQGPWTEAMPLQGIAVRAMACDAQGSLWFATGQGLHQLHHGAWSQLGTSDGLPDAQVLALHAHPEGLLVGTAKGAALIEAGTVLRADTTGMPSTHVQAVLQTRNGATWLGTPEGLVLFERGITQGRANMVMREANGLGSHDILGLLEDRSGAIWIGTAFGGLAKLAGMTFMHFNDRDGLPSRIVTAIHRTPDGTLWLGTHGGGVARYDGRLIHMGRREGLTDPNVRALGHDRKGNLLVGTAQQGVFVLERGRFTPLGDRGMRGVAVNVIRLDAEGRDWAGTDMGLFCDPGDHVVMRVGEPCEVHDLVTAGDTIWLATDRGLRFVDTRRMPWRMETHDLVPERRITSLMRDGMGNLWMGTAGLGLLRLDGRRVRAFTTRDGLSSDLVKQVLLDAYEDIWVGTRHGLDHLLLDPFQESVIEVVHYGPADGFPGMESFSNACMLDHDSTLWFGTVRGATRYDPHRIFEDSNEPITRITGIELFFQAVDWSPWCEGFDAHGLPIGLRLPHDRNHLTFTYEAISLVHPEKVRYRFQLEGYDPDPSPITSTDRVTYSNLPPGSYTFTVEARNGSNYWNQVPITFSFTIDPPFWRTKPFMFSSAGSGILLVMLLVRWRESRLRRERARLELMVADRTSELAVEKQRSDALLRNILPEATAAELKEHGSAQARRHERCSVLFSDFAGFTAFSGLMDSAGLVAELDRSFRAFDELCDRYGVEKIKTIGDAYMCATGLPKASRTHALDIVLMGLAMMDVSEKLNARRREQGAQEWPIRIGIHSGPVVAGVVGGKKFAYDIWGDTVNLASRMESQSAPGCVNVSGATYAQVMDYVIATPRGPIKVKGKGELHMYFVERLKPEYSKDAAGHLPNEKLLKLLGRVEG